MKPKKHKRERERERGALSHTNSMISYFSVNHMINDRNRSSTLHATKNFSTHKKYLNASILA